MSPVGSAERDTQDRVISLFKNDLGYEYLGDWSDRTGNSNIEEQILEVWLLRKGYSAQQISKAIYNLTSEAKNQSRSLYDNNKAVYSLLRYGVQVKVDAGENTETISLVDWKNPEENHFAIAEEVTLDRGSRERRPDIVLYLNGIAIGVLELKNSRASIGDGIRQSISNQSPEFNEWFYTTAQFLFAGNDSEGLRYGTIMTPEKFYLTWKEDEQDNTRLKLDKYLLKICDKQRFIELLYDFVLFDGGIKKLPRPHQYFGVKAAHEHAMQKKGGIIWHSQGTGKSIVMVLLAKWILENNPNARVAVVTDRDELDKQIKTVFTDMGIDIYRASSGRDLLSKLGQATPRMLCSLIHKFGRHEDNFEQYIKELEGKPSPTVGEIFVFVDECHRTQTGTMHRAMKAMMPDATFIGFTGTPLLKSDKQTSREVFGGYIHTYKFDEAVEDKVVLDLVYEARDIEQRLGSQDNVDRWFDAKTSGLNDWQKAALRRRWGTMQQVLSASSRMEKVASDIELDFAYKPRLSSQRGTAMLVASSIFEACKYFEIFQRGSLRGKCAVVTSYNPSGSHVSLEDSGASTDTDKQFIFNIYNDVVLKDTQAQGGMTATEVYEEKVKDLFKNQPANMKLLVVVDKLLTGFDAPSCTQLYVDKSMKDHGLFQAICRTNRLDGDDKDFGYIVDYKDLFKRVEDAIAVYTSELDAEEGEKEPAILLKDRLVKGKERFEEALQNISYLCEPVENPRGDLEHIHYFCGNTEIPEELDEREPQRAALYRATVSLVRAYAGISDEMSAAGYEEQRINEIKKELGHYVKLRDVIRHASGETIDLKAYEADMRHLLDMYIEADSPRKISPFEDTPLVELIVKAGIAGAVDELPDEIKKDKGAVTETITNNVRSKIIKEQLKDPTYYNRMSVLLEEILSDLRDERIQYEEYLQRIADLAKRVQDGRDENLPASLTTPGLRALYGNLNEDEELAHKLDKAIKTERPDQWRGSEMRERQVKRAIYEVLGRESEVERIFTIIREQSEY